MFGIPGDLRQRPLDALQRLLHERGVLQEEERPQEPPHPQFLKKEGTSTRDFILTGLRLRPLTFDLSVFSVWQKHQTWTDPHLVTHHADGQHPVHDRDQNDHRVANQPLALPELLPANQIALREKKHIQNRIDGKVHSD